MIFEVVLESLEEALLAQKFGAKRVEICAALDLGGVTPSQGVVATFVEALQCEIHVMIRPRAGGFYYNADEIAIMKSDILWAHNSGCHGVVFGLLNENDTIDVNSTRMLTNFSKALGLEVTFHRAVDFTPNVFESFDTLVNLGVTRVLTSGGHRTIDEGVEILKKLHTKYDGKIQVMAGGGVNYENAFELINFGFKAIHFNVRKEKQHQSNILMGKEYELDSTKIECITSIVK